MNKYSVDTNIINNFFFLNKRWNPYLYLSVRLPIRAAQTCLPLQEASPLWSRQDLFIKNLKKFAGRHSLEKQTLHKILSSKHTHGADFLGTVMRLLGSCPPNSPAIFSNCLGCLKFLCSFDSFPSILSDSFRRGAFLFGHGPLSVILGSGFLLHQLCSVHLASLVILSHLLRNRNILLSGHLPAPEIIGNLRVAMSTAPSFRRENNFVLPGHHGVVALNQHVWWFFR